MSTESKTFDLGTYLTKGVENIVKGIVKSTLNNAGASKFLIHFAKVSKTAGQKRREMDRNGEHIPPFLIASITNSCNLHCAGCYARANHICFDEKNGKKPLSSEEWGNLFSEAEDLGVSFILLAGGEPMLRTDVLKEAGKHRNILFPVFTNGTLYKREHMELLQKHPNLMPVISIEGGRETTDRRRGDGVYEKTGHFMEELRRNGIVFGVSVTVTKGNLGEVMSHEFAADLYEKGCKAIIYVEYVPVNEQTKNLAPGENDRIEMKKRIDSLRRSGRGMLFISFPGDEKESGGCLAAGRGFFHINAFGAAEPCPFSAYSDTNVLETGIRQALKSKLFRSLNENGILKEEHAGGCVLYEREDMVRALCGK